MRQLASTATMVFAVAFAGATLFAPSPASAQVVLVVNGAPVTALDIEQRTRLEFLSTRKQLSRQEVINTLIDDRLKVAVGKRYGLEMTDAEVDQSFAELAKRTNVSPEQFAQQLQASGVSAAALKARLRADTVWQQLVRGRFGSSLQVGESDVALAMKDSPAATETVGYIYNLRPIVFIVPRNAGDAAIDQRRREAEAFRSRFDSCDTGVKMARGLRDVAVRPPVTRTSADVAPQMRDLLASLAIGKLSTPERIEQGLQMFALCDKKTSKEDAPAKREVREKLVAQRFDTEAKKFLAELRRQAMIEYRR